MSKYAVIDLETGTKVHIGRKACWLVNDVVAYSIKDKDTQITKYIDKKEDFYNIPAILYHCKIDILVGHNIKFDLLYLWEDIQRWLSNGGRIFDTQLAEYILTGQQNLYSSLLDKHDKKGKIKRQGICHKYGCKAREFGKRMESFWDKSIDTKDIPRELVLEDVSNDVLDTETVMLKQVKELKRLGMYELCMEMNESLLATTEMEYNGIFIERQIMAENKIKLIEEVKNIMDDLTILASPYYETITKTEEL